MRKITIKKLSDNPNPTFKQGNLGEFVMLTGPSVGKTFNAMRVSSSWKGIFTTTVKSVEYVDDKTIRFKTMNSEYEIVMGEAIND